MMVGGFWAFIIQSVFSNVDKTITTTMSDAYFAILQLVAIAIAGFVTIIILTNKEI